MQKIEIHDIQAILNQMNDELVTFQEYKQKKIQKIYEVFKLDREKLKTITHVSCSNVLYPYFLEYFGDVIKVKYTSLLEAYQFIFTDESEMNKLKAESWQKLHDEIGKGFDFSFSLIKPFDSAIHKYSYED